jgi:hypothetical protein
VAQLRDGRLVLLLLEFSAHLCVCSGVIVLFGTNAVAACTSCMVAHSQNFQRFSDAAPLVHYLITRDLELSSYLIRSLSLDLIRSSLHHLARSISPTDIRPTWDPWDVTARVKHSNLPHYDQKPRVHHGVASQQNARIPVTLPGGMGLECVGSSYQGRNCRC